MELLFSYNSVVINVFKGEKFINNHKRIIVHLIGSIFNLYFGYCKNGGGSMYVYDTKAIREMDHYAAQQGLSLFTLMENAGRGIAESLQKKVHKNAHILILAGRGNNGGDGIVAARYLKQTNYNVSLVLPLGPPKSETAIAHYEYFKQCGYTADSWNFQEINKTPYPLTANINAESASSFIIIDALLGIGVNLPLRKNVSSVVQWANRQRATRYAIDIPTGVNADHGEIEAALKKENTNHFLKNEPTVFEATATFVLHGAKPSAYLRPSSQYYGEIIPISIGLNHHSNIRETMKKDVRSKMPKRVQDAHKGTFGKSLLIAGSNSMPGSALLAATGAIRSGTGLLMIATTTLATTIIASQVPEATYVEGGLGTIAKGHLPEKVSAIGIGPGLDDTEQIQNALYHLMKTDIPLVVDAGALLPNNKWERKTSAPTILTPHPGEFSRMTDVSIKDIEENRISIAQSYARKNKVILVLKGQSTIIALPNGHVRINPTGNSALAKGGSGDVLTGMITSMLSFYKSPEDAVTNAVYLHGLCAEQWGENNSEAAMTASDFAKLLPKVLRKIQT